MKCSRNPACVSVDGHADLCMRINGTLILQPPFEVRRTHEADTGWIDGNANHPRHTVPHPKRTPEAAAQIAAAREPPDAFEIAMQTGVDDAFEERVRAMNDTSGLRKGLTEEQRIDLALEEQTRGHIDRLRSVLSANRTPAGKLDAVLEEVRSGHVPADVARRVLNESPSAPTSRVLTTNHPEVIEPAERARLGLDPVDAFGQVYRDPFLERMRADHAATPDPVPMSAVDEPQSKEPSVVLTGNDLDTFESFARCAAALEQHAERGQALQVAYRDALQAVSAMAARRNRGR